MIIFRELRTQSSGQKNPPPLLLTQTENSRNKAKKEEKGKKKNLRKKLKQMKSPIGPKTEAKRIL